MATIAQQRGGMVIFLSFVVALMLTIIPLPTWGEEIRPHWVMIALIYWAMALPQRVGVGVGWILGLLLDVIFDSVLGQHALGLAIIAFFIAHLHQRQRVFPLWQQAIVVFFYCLVYSVINLWIQGITGNAPNFWLVLIPCFTTAIIWPFAFFLLRHIRRYYRVS